jgi:ribonuclease HII
MKVRIQVKTEEMQERITLLEDQLAATKNIETIVNNLPEALDSLLRDGFTCQAEFRNETDYRVATLGDAILAQVKAQARGAVVTWDAAIAKCQKLHKEFNREQAIAFLRKTQTGESLELVATMAEAVKTKLS